MIANDDNVCNIIMPIMSIMGMIQCMHTYVLHCFGKLISKERSASGNVTSVNILSPTVEIFWKAKAPTD